jgi:hypothetical protein
MGKLKGIHYVQDAPDSFDPSEACNATELWPQFRKYFDVVAEYRHAALSYPMFEGIAQNLALNDPSTRQRIKVIVDIERLLTRLRVVQPLFVVAIGRKKPGVF